MEHQDTNNSQWMDRQQVLQMLHLSASTLKRWRRSKLIAYSKLGGKIFYDRQSLLQTLEANKVAADEAGTEQAE